MRPTRFGDGRDFNARLASAARVHLDQSPTMDDAMPSMILVHEEEVEPVFLHLHFFSLVALPEGSEKGRVNRYCQQPTTPPRTSLHFVLLADDWFGWGEKWRGKSNYTMKINL